MIQFRDFINGSVNTKLMSLKIVCYLRQGVWLAAKTLPICLPLTVVNH